MTQGDGQKAVTFTIEHAVPAESIIDYPPYTQLKSAIYDTISTVRLPYTSLFASEIACLADRSDWVILFSIRIIHTVTNGLMTPLTSHDSQRVLQLQVSNHSRFNAHIKRLFYTVIIRCMLRDTCTSLCSQIIQRTILIWTKCRPAPTPAPSNP